MDALDFELAEQRSKLWFDIRLGRFTSSEIHKLMQSGRGNNVFSQTGLTYINTKVGEVLTGVKVDNPYSQALVYGEEMETEAREYFTKQTGMDVITAEFVPFTDHAGGSPDGYILRGDKKVAGLEIKCPFNSANQVNYLFLKDQNDLRADYPEYYWQVQSGMLFTGLEEWYFATYDPRMKSDKHKLKVLRVERNIDEHNHMVGRIEIAIELKLNLIKKLS